MGSNSYATTIEVAQSPKNVFQHINDVAKWWNNNLEGSSTKLNDEFIVSHDGLHYSKQKLVEFIPDRKIVWLVTDSLLSWLERDKHEWTGTKMIFEITPSGDKTTLHFTHEGIVPEVECYNLCVQGWDLMIKGRLFRFIEKNIPFWEGPEAAREMEEVQAKLEKLKI